jgi:hypothetical protein
MIAILQPPFGPWPLQAWCEMAFHNDGAFLAVMPERNISSGGFRR